MERKLQKIYLTYYNLLIAQDLWQAKCKIGYDDKKCETSGIKYRYCGCFLEYKNFKDDLIE